MINKGKKMLEIKNLSVCLDDKELLSNINLTIDANARHLLTGHNGSGKSTLVSTIAGTSKYRITQGQIIFNGKDITSENITTRALLGIFLGAQHVPEISGLSVLSFLKHSMLAHTHFQTGHDLSMADFLSRVNAACAELDIPKDWLNRSINVGFSGGERKRLMLLRLILTNPLFAILDEPDSGADKETLHLIATTIKKMKNTTFLFISHQSNFTDMIEPTATSALSNGKNMI